MKLFKLLFALTLMLMIYTSPASAEYSYQMIVPPGSLGITQLFGINEDGIVTGEGWDGAFFSFTYDMESGEYTTSYELSVLEISNSGVMVGDVNGVCAIRDKKGNITTFVPPSWTVGSFCQARGVNSKGKVSGFLRDEPFDNWLGFIYDPKKDTYEEFLPSSQTFAVGINAQGQNVGSVTLDADEAYPGTSAGSYGYLRQKDGSVKYFAISESQGVPGWTRARGISENGLISGWYLDAVYVVRAYGTT